jgi:c-di-GMP-binding flagellar brake protein YcgR
VEQDRRRFLRFDTSLGMKYKVPFTDTEGAATLKNVSRAGMGLCVVQGRALPKAVSADFEIDLPGEPLPILAKVRVVWAEETDREASITNGVEFVDIKPADKNALLEYAYNLWVEANR